MTESEMGSPLRIAPGCSCNARSLLRPVGAVFVEQRPGAIMKSPMDNSDSGDWYIRVVWEVIDHECYEFNGTSYWREVLQEIKHDYLEGKLGDGSPIFTGTEYLDSEPNTDEVKPSGENSSDKY